MSIRHITKHHLYGAVAPDDFRPMLDIERHLSRSSAFDKIIAASEDHYWDPLDKRYVDLDQPFDLEAQALLPDFLVPTLSTDYVGGFFADKPRERIAFINQIARWNMSSILHGEQGALNLSASLCHVLRDPAAQEYAANQCREEARHVTAFAKYIRSRWGSPLPCGPTLADLLNEIVHAPEVYKKVVGMQIVVEGLAMGAFATIHKEWTDPVLKRLTQLVMTDEAFHHKFGKAWADRTIPKLDAEEHALVEDWAARCFTTLLFNLMAPSQMRGIYESFGMDPDKVIAAFQAFMTDGERRKLLARSTNLFRSLVKTLWRAGIITDRTKPIYAMYVDFEEFAAESEDMPGESIATQGLALLKSINHPEESTSLAPE
jgi:hypothetical protein